MFSMNYHDNTHQTFVPPGHNICIPEQHYYPFPPPHYPHPQYPDPRLQQNNGYIYEAHSPELGAAHPNLNSSFRGQFRPDSSGWYIPVPRGSASNPNQYEPPGLRPREPPIAHVTTAESAHRIEMNKYWEGRFAPFPGFSSNPGLLPIRENQKIKISEPSIKKKKAKPTLQLLPPKSFMVHPDLETPKPAPSLDEKEAPQDHKSFHFDKYVDAFVPQYLKDVQKQPHNLLPMPPVPVFPSQSYIQSFLLPHLIRDLSKQLFPSLLSAPPPTECLELQIKTYYEHWMALLSWELDNLALAKEQIVLWKIGVQVVIWADAEFVLFVPGIRENYPRLEIGDLVHLREVYERLQKGSGNAFEGRVVALRKREGFIHISCPALQQFIQYVLPPNPQSPGIFTSEDVLPFAFNVSFAANAGPAFAMDAAAAKMNSALTWDVGPHNLARYWLFPDPEDLDSPLSVSSVDQAFLDHDWVDSGLNPEQRLAVSSIALHQSPVPYLISGPPGTGKTRTVVETVLQIMRAQPESCILLCAPSNPATDTLALRLLSFLKPNQMLRLNDQNRTFAEVPIKLTQYCYVENDKFALPPWKMLMAYRVVVCSCLDAGILVGAHCTNSTLARIETELSDSLHPHRPNKPPITPHWTHLLIDEAAQGSEPELLIPISVVHIHQTGSNLSDRAAPMLVPQITLCGDPQQLGPIVTSEKARAGELDVSLLERLFDRPLYADHANARSRLSRLQSQPVEVYKFTPFTNLVKNYRSHPAILMPPSAIFYDDSLVPCATNGMISWSGLPNPDLPLVFFGHDAKEECVDERATWYNTGEIDKIVEIITSLLNQGGSSSPPLRPAEIGIMAPWREQVWKLRERLRNEKLSAVDVGNVEDYQGRESRVVIISCVRSNARFLKEDMARGLGLVFEKKRMNVAITRAKELLIVVGNGAVLKQDPYWKGFLQFTMRNNLYVGPSLDLELDGNYISRLESYYFNTREAASEDEVRGAVTAGGIAREILGGG